MQLPPRLCRASNPSLDRIVTAQQPDSAFPPKLRCGGVRLDIRHLERVREPCDNPDESRHEAPGGEGVVVQHATSQGVGRGPPSMGEKLRPEAAITPVGRRRSIWPQTVLAFTVLAQITDAASDCKLMNDFAHNLGAQRKLEAKPGQAPGNVTGPKAFPCHGATTNQGFRNTAARWMTSINWTYVGKDL